MDTIIKSIKPEQVITASLRQPEFKKFMTTIDTIEITSGNSVHTYSIVEILDGLTVLAQKLKLGE